MLTKKVFIKNNFLELFHWSYDIITIICFWSTDFICTRSTRLFTCKTFIFLFWSEYFSGEQYHFRLSSEEDNLNLKKMLLDNRLLSIANFNLQPPLVTRERREDRYLVVGIDPVITKASKISSSKDQIFKIIRDNFCSIDPNNSSVITSM